GILVGDALLSLSTRANLEEAFLSSHSRVIARVKLFIGTFGLAMLVMDVPLSLAISCVLSVPLLDLTWFEFLSHSAITSLCRFLFLSSLTSSLRFWMESWNLFAPRDVLDRLVLGEVSFKCGKSLSKSLWEILMCSLCICNFTFESTLELRLGMDMLPFAELCPVRGLLNMLILAARTFFASASSKGTAKLFKSVSSFNNVEFKAVLVVDELELGGFTNFSLNTASALSSTFVAHAATNIHLDCPSLAGRLFSLSRNVNKVSFDPKSSVTHFNRDLTHGDGYKEKQFKLQ
uniref:Uncharacterized protein n=1 Tax=Glossina palpalis gambiensis TaxID=67801 RepID=A0A1B0BMT2_9MUSC